VTPPIQQYSGTLTCPAGNRSGGSPIATTLIYGEHNAVLVDPPFTSNTAPDVLTCAPVTRPTGGPQAGRSTFAQWKRL
jgi:hypothetical protein